MTLNLDDANFELDLLSISVQEPEEQKQESANTGKKGVDPSIAVEVDKLILNAKIEIENREFSEALNCINEALKRNIKEKICFRLAKKAAK